MECFPQLIIQKSMYAILYLRDLFDDDRTFFVLIKVLFFHVINLHDHFSCVGVVVLEASNRIATNSGVFFYICVRLN
jgi:hypothetical protein